ncbi:MAG: hypothetical protein AAF517_15225 [Planctomycetota bacterium]
MKFPRVQLSPGESIYKADEKVEKAFEEAGMSLVAFDGLNSFHDVAAFCHFFQVSHEDGLAVVVVNASAWEEKTLIQVLNVLLEICMDPDPPGSRVSVEFYSSHDVPKVLTSVFGGSDCCVFESRALLVARFGHDVQPAICTQLGALASFLLRDTFGASIGFTSEQGVATLEATIESRFFADPFCSEPINSLIVLGCLYGEIHRSRVSLSSDWTRVESDPWPVIVFSGGSGAAVSGTDSVVFSPIAHTIHFFQSREGRFLLDSADDLLRRCQSIGGKVAYATTRITPPPRGEGGAES